VSHTGQTGRRGRNTAESSARAYVWPVVRSVFSIRGCYLAGRARLRSRLRCEGSADKETANSRALRAPSPLSLPRPGRETIVLLTMVRSQIRFSCSSSLLPVRRGALVTELCCRVAATPAQWRRTALSARLKGGTALASTGSVRALSPVQRPVHVAFTRAGAWTKGATVCVGHCHRGAGPVARAISVQESRGTAHPASMPASGVGPSMLV
jgi:hypothetical protein